MTIKFETFLGQTRRQKLQRNNVSKLMNFIDGMCG